jgi:antitoxin VapB
MAHPREEAAMTLGIKDPEADRLAKELARRQGETVSDAVVGALRDALARTPNPGGVEGTADKLLEIARRYSGLPTLDNRSEDEILGYDDGAALR